MRLGRERLSIVCVVEQFVDALLEGWSPLHFISHPAPRSGEHLDLSPREGAVPLVQSNCEKLPAWFDSLESWLECWARRTRRARAPRYHPIPGVNSREARCHLRPDILHGHDSFARGEPGRKFPLRRLGPSLAACLFRPRQPTCAFRRRLCEPCRNYNKLWAPWKTCRCRLQF